MNNIMKNDYLFQENLAKFLRKGVLNGETYMTLHIVKQQLSQWELQPSLRLGRLINLAEKRIVKVGADDPHPNTVETEIIIGTNDDGMPVISLQTFLKATNNQGVTKAYVGIRRPEFKALSFFMLYYRLEHDVGHLFTKFMKAGKVRPSEQVRKNLHQALLDEVVSQLLTLHAEEIGNIVVSRLLWQDGPCKANRLLKACSVQKKYRTSSGVTVKHVLHSSLSEATHPRKLEVMAYFDLPDPAGEEE